MRGSDRCDEIVRLIDGTLGSAPTTEPMATSSGRPATRHGLLPRSLPCEGGDAGTRRRLLLEAVEEYLAVALSEVA
jgi:hypothetical protein